jgi:hypothetical protein
MAKPASLTSNILSKKGEAAPAAPDIKMNDNFSKGVINKDYFKALTVKLDKSRYMKLKQTGLQLDKSSQELFIEALDAYLNKAT